MPVFYLQLRPPFLRHRPGQRWLGRDHGGAAEVWLAQQAVSDLRQARAAVKASKALSGVKTLKLQTA
jgi:hypothetical protein